MLLGVFVHQFLYGHIFPLPWDYTRSRLTGSYGNICSTEEPPHCRHTWLLMFVFVLLHINNKNSQSTEKSTVKVVMYENVIVTFELGLGRLVCDYELLVSVLKACKRFYKLS